MWFRSWFSHLPPPGRPWACSLHQPYWEVKALWCSSARGFAVTCWLAQAAADWAVPGPPPLIPPNPPSHTQTHCSPSTAYTWLSPEGPPHSHWWILKPRSAGKPPTCVITYLTLSQLGMPVCVESSPPCQGSLLVPRLDRGGCCGCKGQWVPSQDARSLPTETALKANRKVTL